MCDEGSQAELPAFLAVAHRWELLTPGVGIAVGSEVYLLAAVVVFNPSSHLPAQPCSGKEPKQVVLKDDYRQALLCTCAASH